MKLDAEPRLGGASAPVLEWARKVAQAVNKNDDVATKADATQATQIATLNTLVAQAAPPSAVGLFAQNTAPTGWLKANGAAVSRTTYAALFTAIGTTFGVGDGSTTFNVPDLRGEFPRGWDDARGVDTGRVFGSAQADAFQGHGHAVNVLANSAGATRFFYASGSTVNGTTATAVGATVFEAQSALAAGNGTPRIGNETRPRNVALLFCIKY
jgi:phage-related tail fiber protein